MMETGCLLKSPDSMFQQTAGWLTIQVVNIDTLRGTIGTEIGCCWM